MRICRKGHGNILRTREITSDALPILEKTRERKSEERKERERKREEKRETKAKDSS